MPIARHDIPSPFAAIVASVALSRLAFTPRASPARGLGLHGFMANPVDQMRPYAHRVVKHVYTSSLSGIALPLFRVAFDLGEPLLPGRADALHFACNLAELAA